MVDFDVVDISNLQRQILFGVDQEGKSKLESAKERLVNLNPHTDYILHEVALSSENALEIIITLPGGEEYEAVVIGTDSMTDLALLKLEGGNFPFATLGNSDELIIGEWVVALGNPYGLFDVSDQPTATAGIISAVNMDFGQQKSGQVFQNMIQTDAAINPGNSGGPLLNENGEIIGVVVSTLNARYFYENESIIPQNVNFAIKGNYVANLISILPEYHELSSRKNLLLGKSLEEKIELISPFIVTIK